MVQQEGSSLRRSCVCEELRPFSAEESLVSSRWMVGFIGADSVASVRVHLRDGGRDTVSVACDEGVSAAALAEPVSSVEVGDVLGKEGGDSAVEGLLVAGVG